MTIPNRLLEFDDYLYHIQLDLNHLKKYRFTISTFFKKMTTTRYLIIDKINEVYLKIEIQG